MDNIYKGLLQSYKDGTFLEALNTLANIPPPPTVQGDKYIPYPSIDDDRFFEKINNKREFIDTSPQTSYETFEIESANRCSNATFKLSPHQLFVKRFLSPLTPYNGLLLYHNVGVGKTCSAISIAEQYIGLYSKKVLVVLSGNLKDNFKKQIFDITKYNESGDVNLCTGTKYSDMIIDRKQIPKEMFEKRINKLINDRYQFIGYKELVNLMDKTRSRIEKSSMDPSKKEQRYKEKIREYFSDRLVIIDEAHNLRMPSETGKKRISVAFQELFELVENTKLLLMTATPMFNDPREIVWLLNLLLTNDKKPSLSVADLFDKTGMITKKGANILREKCKGYVSYMRGENPFSFPFRIYPDDKNVIKTFPSYDMKEKAIPVSNKIKDLILIGSEMSPKQIMFYEETRPKIQDIDEDEDLDEDESDESLTSDMQNMLQVSNIIYPTSNIKRSFGEKGFNQCFVRSKNSKGLKYEYVTPQQFLSPKFIKQYAPKLARVVEYVTKAKGIVFIYSQYYYSGIIPIALALEHIGFNKLNGNLGDKFEIDQQVELINGKRPNYVILSRNKELSPNNDREIALAKSSENREGEQIKVVIVSKIGTEGLDFKRIREMHLIDPWFNMNRAEQIIGRGVRTCSHIDLPKEKRNVSIYMHATTLPDEEEESIDMRVYRIAENKQRKITLVEDILKSSAIDCLYNTPNLRFPISKLKMTFDIETSQNKKITSYKVGDVDNKIVKCASEKLSDKNVSDMSTFNLLLLDDEIAVYKKYVIAMFKGVRKNSYSEILLGLSERYKSIDEDVLKYTLEQMLEDPYVFEGYKGKTGYLVYAGDKYVFTTDEISTDIQHKSRLPLNVLTNANKKPKSPETVAQNSVMEVDFSDIFDIIKKDVEGIMKHVGQKYEPQAIDAIVDRLDTEKLIKLALAINKNLQHPWRAKIEKSLDSASFMLKDSNGKIDVFYNHTDSEFYCGSEFKVCTALDLAKLAKQIKELKARLFKDHGPSVKGFIQHKNGDAKFKVRDGTSAGYVCFQTPSLQVEELKNRIISIDDGVLTSNVKLAKVKLCEIYELLLRKEGKIARPFLRTSEK